MTKTSQPQRVFAFLQQHPNTKMTARDIAVGITQHFDADYIEKRKSPRFKNETAFLAQVTAEIGAHKKAIIKQSAHIFWQDKPRPRVYWYDPNNKNTDTQPTPDELETLPTETDHAALDHINQTPTQLSEHDLYPVLIAYLKSEHQLYCKRIDEKRSKNSYGSNGNQWLHPDLVAMQTLDKAWDELVRTCLKDGSAGQRVKLWSFEVKKELTLSNLRSSFFQAVSNSSWANEGYLVAASIANANVEQELRMLSALHGIGFILLNTQNPSESDVLLPATIRADIDWQSVNRILKENADFRDYIESVANYYQTGRLGRDWNKH